MRVTWEQFDGQKFQRFCNELLLFEVSKHARVFSAPGPDGGIDQLFYGSYSGKDGDWRFQDKFHLSGNSSQDWSALKRDVANDIQNNYAGENFLVFITNVNLTPTKENELLKIAQDTLKDCGVSCEPIIWHGAFLESILVGHPVIYHWHWGNGSTSLRRFTEFFAANLTTLQRRGVSFANEFFGREDDLHFLETFLDSEERLSLALVSNGGYGKTRLCIELMQRTEQGKGDWIPLVLVHRGYNSIEFTRLLEQSGRLLILLDNANEVPDIVDDVKRQVEATRGRVKLLLTTRNTLFNQALGRMSSHNSYIEKYKIMALTPEVTLKMLHEELPNVQHRNLIVLRDISRGVPNVILELVAAIRNGENANSISGHNFFATSVQKIVQEAANSIFAETGIAQVKTIDLLQLLSIISPVNSDKNDILFIATLTGLSEDKVEVIINSLLEAGLIEKTRTISIKPDPYSDVILAETCKRSMRLIERIKDQQGSEKYVENIIKNLAEAEIPGNEKELFTQQMLRDYFAIIANPLTPSRKLKGAVELARDLSYTKPASAMMAVNEWIKHLNIQDAPVFSQNDDYSQKPLVETINEIIADILGNVTAEAFVHDDTKLAGHFVTIEQFIKASNYYKVLHASFGFRHWHCKCIGFQVNNCCGLQYFLKDIVVQYLSRSNDPMQINIALEAHDVLMELEFNERTYCDNYTMTLHWGRYELPDCTHTKQFRIESLQAIIAFYNSGRVTIEQKQGLLPALTRQLYKASKNNAERFEFNTDDELNIILPFLEERLNAQPELWEKIQIADATKVWNKGEFRPEFEAPIKAIGILAKAASSLKEELQLLLGNLDYFDSRNNAGKNGLRILKEYNNDEQFQEDFISISYGGHSIGTPFHECITAFVAQEPLFSKNLLDRIIQNYPDQIPAYSLLIRANHTEEKYFDETIATILSKHPEHIGSVVWMILYGRNQEAEYRRASDFDIFETAVTRNDVRAIHLLDAQLIKYIFVHKDRTISLYDTIIPLLRDEQIAGMFYHIYSDKAVTNQFPEDLLALLNRHYKILPLDQTFGGDEILSFIEEKFSQETLYDFVRKWIEQKVTTSTYGLFSVGDRRLGNKAGEEDIEVERFMLVLKKFIMLSAEHFTSRTERQLLKVFRPTKGFTTMMQEGTMALLENHKTNEQVLIGLAKALSLFPPMTESLVVTMCAIADAYVACSKALPTANQIADFFGSGFYHNTGGVRSKSGKGPFPVDVQKKKLFEKVIDENQFSQPTMHFLGKCLEHVLNDIAREIESDQERNAW